MPGAEDRKFCMGRLDHVHIRVPDRGAAAAWYSEHLGFEPVEKFDFWATGFEGGPLQISADGGKTMLGVRQPVSFEARGPRPGVADSSIDEDSATATHNVTEWIGIGPRSETMHRAAPKRPRAKPRSW